MTVQLELFAADRKVSGAVSAASIDVAQFFESSLPPDLAEEFAGVAERLRNRLYKVNAELTEIGRELRSVRARLPRAQFLSWVSTALGISRRAARSIMRTAEGELLGSSRSGFEQNEKLAAHVQAGGAVPNAPGRSSDKGPTTHEEAWMNLVVEANRTGRGACVSIQPGEPLEDPTIEDPDANWVAFVQDRGGLGPAGFDQPTLGRFANRASRLALVFSAPDPSTYRELAGSAAVLSRVLIVGTTLPLCAAWLRFLKQHTPLVPFLATGGRS
jgi:hypothetical protein